MTSRVNVAKEYTIALSTEDSAIINESTLLLFYNDCRNGRIEFLPQRSFIKPLCAEKKKKIKRLYWITYTLYARNRVYLRNSLRVVSLTSA